MKVYVVDNTHLNRFALGVKEMQSVLICKKLVTLQNMQNTAPEVINEIVIKLSYGALIFGITLIPNV